MDRRTYNDDGDADLVFVLGWGNRHEHETVQWLIDRLAGEGYRVHVFQIPDNGGDFEADYRRPVAAFVADLDEYRLLGHSTGGLIGEHVRDPPPETRTYLSPWWAFTEDQDGLLLDLVAKVPLGAQLLPAGTADRDALGSLATDRMIADNPGRISPRLIGEVKRAQADLPPFGGEAVVFYNPEDTVVGTRAIEDRVPADHRVAFEGGHELFSSPSRDRHLETLLAAIDRGPDALTSG